MSADPPPNPIRPLPPSPGPAPAAAASQASASPRASGAGELLTAETLLEWRRQLLRQGGRAADLDWLIDLEGGVPWSLLQQLRLHPQRPVLLQRSRADLEALWQQHRCGAVPLQYLVGRCPWRDLELAVAPGVLIPRQETEVLVELLRQGSRSAGCGSGGGELAPFRSPLRWADLGTGSGCLAIALARLFPAAQGLAVDCSGVALQQAALNLASHGVQEQVRLLQGRWWDPLQPWWGQLDLVVANPPYIPAAQIGQLDPVVRDHEPRLALDGGPDGLDCIRAIVGTAPQALAVGGLLMLEHHHDQSQAVLDLLHSAGLGDARAHADLEGVPRFASARRLAVAGEPGQRQDGMGVHDR